MAEPGAELARDVVSCPGADTCNLAVTQSRGLAVRDRRRARGRRPRRGRRRARQHLGLHEQLRPAPHLRHRVHGARAPCPRPGRARLPDAARRPPRRHGGRVRRQGRQAAGQGCAGSRRARSSVASPTEREAGETFTDVARPCRRRQGRRRLRQGPRQLPDARRSRPTSTSTTTRPARTSPRSATASARRRDGDEPHDTQRHRRPARSSTSTSASWPRSPPSWSTSPRARRSAGRTNASAPGSCWPRRSRTACSSTSRCKAAPEHRGRVPRHAVPLRRDALVRRPGRASATT